MFDLFLAVLFSSFIFIIFKLFAKYNINTLQAIITNYIVAFFVGFMISPADFSINTILSASWLYGSIFLGFMFICVFNILGKATQLNGISVASVSSKMAMIIPIIFGIVVLNENIGISKIIGIIAALLAVYFTSKKENCELKTSINFLFPILLFFGAGIIDTGMNYVQHYHVKENEASVFVSFTFIFAFIFGIIFLTIRSLKYESRINGKNMLAGIILGVPNYFSMHYLIKALQNSNLESATIFTLINIGVILLTIIFSLLFFKEKIKRQNFIGILLALIAVFLVTR